MNKNDEKLKVMVVGDVMVDEYVLCGVHRLSAEAPIPIADFQRKVWIPGGAANVARNLVDMFKKDIHVGVCGLVAADDAGDYLRGKLKEIGVEGELAEVGPPSNTTIKCRVIAHGTHLCRVDRDMSTSMVHRFSVPINGLPFPGDALIVSDYNKGVLRWLEQYAERPGLFDFFRKASIRIVDVKPQNLHIYEKLLPTHLTINTVEVGQISGGIDALWGKFPSLRGVFETRGELGVRVWHSTSEISDIPSNKVAAVDVTGAGDTFIASVCWGLLNQQNEFEAAKFGNKMASIVVAKFGTATVEDLWVHPHKYQ